MDCCILSSEEVGQLTHYNILPNHENHIHIPHDDAVKGLKDEEYVLIAGRNGRQYLTKEKMYFLRSTPSGGRGAIPIIQRVVSNQPKHLTPIRFKGF